MNKLIETVTKHTQKQLDDYIKESTPDETGTQKKAKTSKSKIVKLQSISIYEKDAEILKKIKVLLLTKEDISANTTTIYRVALHLAKLDENFIECYKKMKE